MLLPAELEAIRVQLLGFTQDYLAALLDVPSAVTLTIDVTPSMIEVEMKFAGSPYDCQRMIGVQGKTITGYRRLLYAVALRHGILRVSVNVVDPWGVRTGEDQVLTKREFSKSGRRPLSGESTT